MKSSTLCGTAHGKPAKVKDAAHRRQAAKDARYRAMMRWKQDGDYPVNGPEDVIAILEDRLGVQVQMAMALDGIVAKLVEQGDMRYEHRAGEQLRGEIQAWLGLNQSVTKLGSDYLKIGLNERKVMIAEAQARILIGVIQAVLGRLELSRDQKRVAARVVPEELERASIESGKK
jgi:hypothetical protein